MRKELWCWNWEATCHFVVIYLIIWPIGYSFSVSDQEIYQNEPFLWLVRALFLRPSLKYLSKRSKSSSTWVFKSFSMDSLTTTHQGLIQWAWFWSCKVTHTGFPPSGKSKNDSRLQKGMEKKTLQPKTRNRCWMTHDQLTKHLPNKSLSFSWEDYTKQKKNFNRTWTINLMVQQSPQTFTTLGMFV